jgi:hypothetical protein
VSYRHMYLLVRRYGETSWTAVLPPVSVDGMIVTSSMSLLMDSRSCRRSGLLPWALLIIGSTASLAANVAVAEPSAVGRLIAAWPSCALIGSYELLMRQVRHAARPTLPVTSEVSHTSAVINGVVPDMPASEAEATAEGASCLARADLAEDRTASYGAYTTTRADALSGTRDDLQTKCAEHITQDHSRPGTAGLPTTTASGEDALDEGRAGFGQGSRGRPTARRSGVHNDQRGTPWSLGGCSDATKQTVTGRHNPASIPAESRRKRYRWAPRAPI